MTAEPRRSRRSAGLHQSRAQRSSPASDRSDAFDRSQAPEQPATRGPGVQYMVRSVSGRPVTGRPDPLEQQQIADGAGALLRQLRRALGMGLRDLERRSGVNRSTISRIERGLRRPRRSVLGWIAWGLDADNVTAVKAQLCAAAGDSLVAESRWSERMHARKAARQLARGGMPCPLPLLAPYAVAALGGMFPEEGDRLRQAQELARRGGVPWPEGLQSSVEALAVAGVLGTATRRELAVIGRSAAESNDYAALKERRGRERRRRAAEREEFAAARHGRGARGRQDALTRQAEALFRQELARS